MNAIFKKMDMTAPHILWSKMLSQLILIPHERYIQQWINIGIFWVTYKKLFFVHTTSLWVTIVFNFYCRIKIECRIILHFSLFIKNFHYFPFWWYYQMLTHLTECCYRYIGCILCGYYNKTDGNNAKIIWSKSLIV